MKRVSILFVFALITIFCKSTFAEIDMTETFFDLDATISDPQLKNGLHKKNLKDGAWEEYYTIDGKGEGVYKGFSKEGKLTGLTTLIDGKTYGIAKIFAPTDGSLQGISIHHNGKLCGIQKSFFPNGRVKNEDSKSEPVAMTYYENGEIYQLSYSPVRFYRTKEEQSNQATWPVMKGEFQEYYDNGFPKAIENYSDTLKRIRHGIWRKYYSEGMIEEMTEYDNGKVIRTKKYDKQGNSITTHE